MKVEIKVEAADLIAALVQLEKKQAVKIISKHLKWGASQVVKTAKQLAPRGETGDLRRAIKVKKGRNKRGRILFMAQGGSTPEPKVAIYSNVQEFGSEKRNIPAGDYLHRAYEVNHQQLEEQIPERIWADIEKEWGAK